MDKKPNILFFFTDDQRFDAVSALGNREIQTPNIDKLAERGTVFTHAHIAGGTAGAICMPSRAMLHTGRTLFHLNGEGQTLSENHALLGETFRQAGYETFGTGKWHNGTDAFARSFSCGDEIFFGGMNDHWNVPACHYDPAGRYEDRALKIPDFSFSNREISCICDHVIPGKHSSELFCDAAVSFLQSHDGRNPFFAYVSFMAPHDPRSMPEEFRKMYNPADIKIPQNFMSMHPVEYGNTSIRDELLASYPRTPEETKKHIAEYYAMISHLDREMGRVLQTLENRGMSENTIILFSSDNGLALGQHGLFGKQNHFEHSIRVPFIIAGSGIPAGERNESYFYLFDVFPTLCELAGLGTPGTVEGKSFASAVRGGESKTRDNLYFAYKDKIRSVKNRRYKLMETVHGGKLTSRLYDIAKDPWELADLSGTGEYRDVAENLRKELFMYRDEWDDMMHAQGRDYWESYAEASKSGRLLP